MEERNKEKQATQKLSYEDLERVAHQLSDQNRQLYSKVQELSDAAIFKRLDYLFKVVESKDVFLADFVNTCIKEIEDIITIPEDQSNNKENNE